MDYLRYGYGSMSPMTYAIFSQVCAILESVILVTLHGKHHSDAYSAVSLKLPLLGVMNNEQ